MKHVHIIISFIIVATLVVVFPSKGWTFTHAPQTIYIGATYNGAEMHVSGEIGKDEDAVVQILGSDQESHFKLKGKVWGIFWMTVAHLTFKHSPSVYMLYLPKHLATMGEKQLEKWGFGYPVIYSKITIEPTPKNKRQIFEDFLKLKQKDRLYKIEDNGIKYSPKGDKKMFEAVVKLPPKIPPGKYEIKVYRIGPNKEIRGVETDYFNIKLTGFPLFISQMAFNHSLLYGILAVIIAVMAGFIMGFLFKDKGGAH